MDKRDLSLFIKADEFNQLNDIVGNIPTKYGLGLVNFFTLIRQKRNTEDQMAEELKKNLETDSDKHKS